MNRTVPMELLNNLLFDINSKCKHMKLIVFRKDERIVCNDCGLEISPIDLLIQVAKGERDLR